MKYEQGYNLSKIIPAYHILWVTREHRHRDSKAEQRQTKDTGIASLEKGRREMKSINYVVESLNGLYEEVVKLYEKFNYRILYARLKRHARKFLYGKGMK